MRPEKGDCGRPFYFFAGAQQRDQGTLTTILWAGLAKSEDFDTLHQPATDQLAQDGELLGRAMPLAVNDADTAGAVVQAFGQEAAEQLARFVAIEAVQVQFLLDHPAPAAQVLEDGAGQARAQIVRLVAALQAVLQADRAVQAFVQRRLLVGHELLRARRRQRAAEMRPVRGGQGLDARHRQLKGSLLRVAR